MNEEVEGQPNGVEIQKTLAVVSNILDDYDFADEVVKHNDWHPGLSREEVAILFLASRYQWAVELLSTQTATLKSEIEGLQRQVSDLSDHVFDYDE